MSVRRINLGLAPSLNYRKQYYITLGSDLLLICPCINRMEEGLSFARQEKERWLFRCLKLTTIIKTRGKLVTCRTLK